MKAIQTAEVVMTGITPAAAALVFLVLVVVGFARVLLRG
jgi:hypothetical protein